VIVLFHGFIAVAPLKHWSVPFHVERNAAPLPRLHRRGPIEAFKACINFPRLHLFHGFIAVAPLKLCWMRPRAWASGALARLHRRGPIEAGRCSGRQTVERTLFHNKGDGTFEDVTDRAGLGGSRGWPTSAAFADFDGDGDLDLFVCHYLHWDPDRSLPCPDPDRPGKYLYCVPRGFEAEPDHIFRNDGGRFVDVPAESGIVDREGRGLGVVVADLDDDGKPDIFVANDMTANNLYRNLGDFRFEDVGEASGAAMSSGGATWRAWALPAATSTATAGPIWP